MLKPNLTKLLFSILIRPDVEDALNHLLHLTAVERMNEDSMHILLHMNAEERDLLFEQDLIHTSIPKGLKATALDEYSVIMLNGSKHKITNYFIAESADGKPKLTLGLEGVPSLVEYSSVASDDSEFLIVRMKHAYKPIALVKTEETTNE